MKVYILNETETELYDSGKLRILLLDLCKRFGRATNRKVGTTEVRHPDGLVIQWYTEDKE